MKEIPLNHGRVALVDDADYELLMLWKWYAIKGKGTYYATRGVWDGQNKKQSHVLMAREIMGATDPSVLVDHRDRNGLNNQRNNLRLCSVHQNNCNKTPKKNRASEYLGVYWYPKLNKWRVKITHNYKTIHVGVFENEIDAAFAYNDAAVKHHGDFANLNEVDDSGYFETSKTAVC